MYRNIRLLLTICLNLLSHKAFPENTIYEMKVCCNSDGVFKLFEIVALSNFQKIKKEVVIFLPFFVFEEKDHGTMSPMAPCVIYSNIMGFMQSKLRE